MIQVVTLELGEALLFTIGKVVAGDEVETPRAELSGIVKLTRKEQICELTNKQ